MVSIEGAYIVAAICWVLGMLHGYWIAQASTSASEGRNSDKGKSQP